MEKTELQRFNVNFRHDEKSVFHIPYSIFHFPDYYEIYNAKNIFVFNSFFHLIMRYTVRKTDLFLVPFSIFHFPVSIFKDAGLTESSCFAELWPICKLI